MPVTVIPACHKPKAHPEIKRAESPDDLLQQSCPDVYVRGETRVCASSFPNQTHFGTDIYPSSSSFVRSAIEAWGRHGHLVLRPEDIWFTILVQMNFYMEKHAETVRDLFVSHTGKRKIVVWADDWSEVLERFRDDLQDSIKAAWMSDWISPGFSTSTTDDETTATVLMMGLMKQYFDYEGGEVCGIPSVTLLGTKQDWQRLLKKCDRLDDFGIEPTMYAQRLRPILSRIVDTFDRPTAAETRDFWNQLVQAKVHHTRTCGQPPTRYLFSGWILGFFYWNSDGRVNKQWAQGRTYRSCVPGSVEYDGMHYGQSPLDEIPIGYAKAKFKMLSKTDENGDLGWDGWILAGSIGKRISNGAPKGYNAALDASGQSSRLKSDNEDDKPGCFRSMLRGLNCFGHKPGSDMSKRSAGMSTQDMDEKHAMKGSVAKPGFDGAHSTIQPLTGWFLIGPQTDVGPFFEGEETYGPTVDAIDSCDGIVHHNED